MMNPALSHRRRLPDHIADAMTTVIDFFWTEQIRDYLARDEAGQAGHIFNEMLTVRQWLRKQAKERQGGQR